jgi:hypothetical protein
MSHAKTILRTIFYQYLALFIGLSIGFIANAEWVGLKSAIVAKSINNIFFPIEFSEEMEENLKLLGASKVWSDLGQPTEFEILGDVVYYNDEFYWCKYKYRDKDGQLQFDESVERIRWKSWEYYHDYEIVDDDEKTLASINRLKDWSQKIIDAINQADKREKEILQEERRKKIAEST